MEKGIDLKRYFKRNKIYLWIFIGVAIVVFISGLVFINKFPEEKKYVSRSRFEIVNGEKTLYLYLGIVNKITTLDDVASVLRSNDVLVKTMEEEDVYRSLEDFRQDIDLYREGNSNVYNLEYIYTEGINGGSINLSIINNYLTVIESRMVPESKELFDVKVLDYPKSNIMDQRTYYRVLSVFLFSIFCGIIVVSVIEIIKRAVKKTKYNTSK